MSQSARSPGRNAAFPAFLVGLGAAGCWVTLDPIIDGTATGSVAGEGSAGGAATDAGTASPLGTCTVTETASSEYFLCPDPKPFLEAAADCQAWGTELASIGSEVENEFVAIESYGPIGTNLWLGGSRDDDLVWSWRDGTVFWRGGRDGAVEPGAYAKWADGEPNDSSTVADEPERCLALTLGGNDWNDRVCSIGLAYACERRLDRQP